MTGLGHSRRQRQNVVLGGRRDGTIEGLRVEVIGDSGAYPGMGAALARNAATMSCGAYAIPSLHWRVRAVVTTTTPIVAYRGAGRPEAAAIIERVIDLFADAVGLDPVTVRRRNFVQPDQFPYVSPGGINYDSGEYEQGLDAVLAAAGY
jgi:carbon-monoxide dehydrogenase large subunit